MKSVEKPSITNEPHYPDEISLKVLSEVMGEIDPKLNLCLQKARKEQDTTTTQAEAPCYQKAIKSWDKALNVNYQFLMKELDAPEAKEIKRKIIEAERQWIKSRDEQFKTIEDWAIATQLATGIIPEDRSIEGLEKKVHIVRDQALAVYGLLADLSDPYSFDKPL